MKTVQGIIKINGKPRYPKHYFRWRAMMYRCYSTRATEYIRYGARGITVCPSWHTFSVFRDWCVATFEKGKTIDRIDNNGPYSPKNCRWATALEQQLNSRVTPARIAGMNKARKIMLQKEVWKKRKRDVRGCFR